MNEKKEMEILLEGAIFRAEKRGRAYNICAWLCYTLAFFSGVVAAFISVAHAADHHTWIPAILALIPSFSLAALTTFNFGSWAQWELDRAFIAKTIRRKLVFATIEEAKALVEEWIARDTELRTRKPSLGGFPLPSKQGNEKTSEEIAIRSREEGRDEN